MEILSAILFGLSSNLDNFIIGISYEIGKKKITFLDNLLIAFIGTIGTFLSMEVGKLISSILPNYLSNFLGAFTIVVMGVYFTIQSVFKKNSESAKLKDLNLKTTLVLSLGLTLNNLGVGIAASATGLNIPLVCFLNFILSLLTIFLGQVLGGKVFGRLLGKYGDITSGILLIILGLIEIFN